MIELSNVLKCVTATVIYFGLWWLEWRLMKPVREENRRKRRERSDE